MKDANGQEIIIGDIVRICGVPDLTGMAPDALRESAPVFEYLVGKRKRVVGVDEIGNAWFEFRFRLGNKTTTPRVGIEPFLLKKPKTKPLTERLG